MIFRMRKATRTAKSFTVDRDVLTYVVRSRGRGSVSERVNEFLRRAIVQEEYDRVEREAAEFFATESAAERRERRAFRKATLRSLARD